jgi:hypothetical protein
VNSSEGQPSTLSRVYEIILAAAARARRRKKGLTGEQVPGTVRWPHPTE